MASAEFLEQALSTNVDENAVNAIVGSLENQLVTPVLSASSQNNFVNVITSQNSNISSNAGSIISGQKFIAEQIHPGALVNSINPNLVSNSSVSFNNDQSSSPSTFTSLSLTGVPNSNETLKEFYTQAQPLSIANNGLTLSTQPLPNGCIPQPTSQGQILHAVAAGSVLPQHQQGNKSINMQPQLVLKQGANTGQVGIQPGMVTVPMTVNSSMPASIPNVMTLNKPGGQNVVVTTQNLGSAQPGIMPNVQILNMRPGAPAVATQKSVATVSPRVVIGTPQVVGTRATAPITLQTLQSLQPGQQGHLLLKTENGQYQLLRVGPAPAASTLTAPQAQTIRLSSVPAHPGVATVSTSVAPPGPVPGQMPAAPVASPVAVSAPAIPSIAPTLLTSAPVAPTQIVSMKASDNTKEKCRNFLANLLDLSSKEPPSVEKNVRNLIQELIDAQVEPEEFCDRLERLLNASPQPCLIGFLKKSLPLLRQSLVTKELIIEGIKPPSVQVAFTNLQPPPGPPMLATTTVQFPREDPEESSSDRATLTPLLPSVIPVTVANPQTIETYTIAYTSPNSSPQLVEEDDDDGENSSHSECATLTPLLPPVLPMPHLNALTSTDLITGKETVVQTPTQKPSSSIAVLQNIPLHTKINVNKVSNSGSKTMTVNSKANFPRQNVPSAGLSTVLTPGKSLLKEKEKKSSAQFSQVFGDDKMAGDDDINDVAAMGGVNLAEETQRILGSTEMIGTQIRSCKEEYLIPLSLMQARVKSIVSKHNLEEPPPEVASLLSHAVQERLKNLIEKLAVIAQHRIDLIIKTDNRYEVTQDVKGQLKFLEELDRVDKKRREDSEREMLLRAAKSRSKNEDPEQAKLKAKAKEMQRAELEELRQREANLTALQAIGPRKKPRLDGPGGSGDSASTSTGHTTSEQSKSDGSSHAAEAYQPERHDLPPGARAGHGSIAHALSLLPKIKLLRKTRQLCSIHNRK
ncbi:transcription initiation factor TFIID subunit 4-like isoform X2 [Anticarsia gemmatalis]|uniref:transcription initiation factor TFIID subunit 4-like isoform X2 n=1 Tax=Anticarsia gemmatalis TaxID=129554 RepID=UPI003F75F0D1